jgi:putative hydrolase of the HAD superfamily
LDFELSLGPPPDKEAFFFSAVGTLIHYNPNEEMVLVEVLKEKGIDITVHVAKVAYLIADHAAPSKYYTVRSKDERDSYWKNYSSELVKNCKIEDPDGKVAEAVSGRLRSPRIWAAFYDAKLTLESLKKQGCLVGVIANAESIVEEALEHAGLSQWIDTVTTSEEAGVEKPDPAIFRRALDKSDLEPKRCVHVGDVPEIDVLGARNAGITPVWLDRNRLARRIGEIQKIETITEVEFMFPIAPHEIRSIVKDST